MHLCSSFDIVFKSAGFTTTVGLQLKTNFEKTIGCQDLQQCVSECQAYEPTYMYKTKCAAVAYNTLTKVCYISSNSKDTVVPADGLDFDKDFLYLERGEQSSFMSKL